MEGLAQKKWHKWHEENRICLNFYDTPIEGLKVIEPFYFEDNRGVLKKSFEKNIFAQNGIYINPVEEIETTSKKGVLRGLHLQLQHSQAKLLRVVRGKIFDVAVDIRKGSPTFGQWDSINLSADNQKMIYIPRGFAHGFCTLTENCEILYKMDNYYTLNSEGNIKWNDLDVGINWPMNNPIISEKDLKAKSFREFIERYGGLEL